VNFTLFSAHAERVELCIFDDEGNEQRFDLPARSGDVWHGFLAMRCPVRVMAIAYTVRGNLGRGIALTRRSYCSIPVRAVSTVT
jgi:pullulanase/glycogen debranching enzyme